MEKAVFLDRDGTIIRDIVYLNDPAGIEIFPESHEALRTLYDGGFKIFIVTNQSGVARGIVQEENVVIINTKIQDHFLGLGIPIADASYCPHPVDGGCLCRKPSPGMITDLAIKHDIDLAKSWMVGDRLSDAEAGLRAGCRSILLQNEITPPIDMVRKNELDLDAKFFVAGNVLDAARIITRDG